MITFINKCVTNYKGFTLLELLFAIVLIAIISSFFIFKNIDNSLDIATKRVLLYLKYTRHQALIDDKFDKDTDDWFRSRYTFRLRRCNNDKGIYYTIHSDKDKNGYIKANETLKDPLTDKYIFSSSKCEEVKSNSKYVLLSKLYNIKKVDMSCNDTSSLGLIAFGNDGKIYSKFDDTDSQKYEITDTCYITLYDNKDKSKTIAVEPNTGYIYLKN